VDGEKISRAHFDFWAGEVRRVADSSGISLGFFEACCAIGFCFFAQQDLDFVVIETGIGGLWDSTNVFSNPVATILVSLGWDHQEILGESLEEILAQKMGILRPNVPCFSGFFHPDLRDFCADCGVPLAVVTESVETNLCGEFQQKNAGLVFRCLEFLGFSAVKIRAGLKKIVLAGRMEWIRQNLLFDVAHNDDAVRLFLREISTIPQEKIFVFGSTRDVTRFADVETRGAWGDWIFVEPETPRAILPQLFSAMLPGSRVVRNPVEGISLALDLAGSEKIVVVFGSFFLAAAVEEFRGGVGEN